MSTLSISLIQADLDWENKGNNLANFSEKIFALRRKTELVVLPEMFNTGFTMNAEAFAETMDGPSITWMKKQAEENRIILTGSLIVKENNNYFNRLLWVIPNGEIGYYDKRHLFGYAGEHKHFTPGNKRLIASVKGWRINLQICYDLRFPVWSRQQVKKTEAEYDVLIYPASWPERRSHAWKTLLCARAIENQCYCIGVNRVGVDGNGIGYSGDSLVVGPLGEVLYHCNGKEDVFSILLDKHELEESRNKFPFLQDADQFFIRTESGDEE
jgi:predicted amidohydrolase